MTTTLSLLVERYSIAGKYCSRVLSAWYTRPAATAKEPTTYLVRVIVPRTQPSAPFGLIARPRGKF